VETKAIALSRRFIIVNLHKTKFFLILFLFLTWAFPDFVHANCQDSDLRKRVTEVAKKEAVDENELLSIIAHESGCHYFTIAWNLPGKPQTAKSKFFTTLEEAKALAKELIATGNYRVDVGIGQINNEAHIQPKGWTLEEVLDPATALNRVAEVLKERGWPNYHSSNPALAKRWQTLALAALDRALLKTQSKNVSVMSSAKIPNSLLVFNASKPKQVDRAQKVDWVIFGDL
jgi:hypothetical protein